MKNNSEIKAYLVSFISISKGDISKLEGEMKKNNFHYEEHISMQNEEKIENSLKISQMKRNLVENFSKERVEKVCIGEKLYWRSIPNISKTKKNNLLPAVLVFVVLLILILIFFNTNFNE